MGIVIRNVSKTFCSAEGDRTSTEVFSDINLEIGHGEFVTLLGPSGCGKSTLLNITAGLEEATEGSVTVDGRLVQGPGADRGVVFQEAALMPWLSVRGNVLFAVKKKLSAEEAGRRADHYLKMVHLSRFADAYPHELSGGMKQRTAIARALAMDPAILLMDEPFGALDEQTRTLLHRQLLEIWKQTEKTIVFVTHNIRESLLLSDRIVLMGARPGGIREVISVELGHPRNPLDKEFAALERRILDLLSDEISKVAKEEYGDAFAD
ncbi:ABC transporter ATP-binding protein [Alteribacter natronophilus]|uniref:ABC transporter ATP-binding protein n=1 Tax=Alteribacter natronophilus TaxID=2583810 RepID=UPI00110ED788|nr:ABC transporter ATP-binding protein [Alteribacter natronophilus]